LVIIFLTEFDETMFNDYPALTSTEKINFLEDDELLKQILGKYPNLGR